MSSSQSSCDSSQDLFEVTVLPDVRVRMRDGVELAVHITRPKSEGRFPVLMGYSPYRMLSTLSHTPSEQEYSHASHSSAYFAARGYVSVNYDARGTGGSGGVSRDIYSEAERQDGFDMVEWIASQPWSNGNVGIWGFSFGGVVAWQVAAMAPPHLKAILVGSGTDEIYGDFSYPGGVPRSLWMFGGYTSMMTALNFAPPDLHSTKSKWASVWDEHLQGNAPWSIPFLEHQTQDEYWLARSLKPNYERIQCPVFVLTGWSDWYPTAELRAFANLRVLKRALVGPWAHYWPEDAFPGPRIDARPEYLKWFDQFLKGVNTGVLNEPPMTIFVRKYRPAGSLVREEPGFWRHENEWPLERARCWSMYLASQGSLNPEPQRNEQAERDSFVYRPSVGVGSGILAQGFLLRPWAMPLDQRVDELHSLVYTTPELESDLEVTGEPVAYLFVSSTADVAYFHVRVCDVAQDGTSVLITDGGLNATHRVSHKAPVRLVPHEIYELRIELKATAYVFPAGHRMRVSISSGDFQNAWPVSRPATNTVLHGCGWPSRVDFPVVALQEPMLSEPRFLPSPNPMPASVPRPEYTITHNLIDETTIVKQVASWRGGAGVNRVTYTVNDRDPAVVVLENEFDFTVPDQQSGIQVQVRMLTASDAHEFRHLVSVEISVNGTLYFSNSWARSFPRIFN